MGQIHDGEAMPGFECKFYDGIRLTEGAYLLLSAAMQKAEELNRSKPVSVLDDLWVAETVFGKALDELRAAKAAFEGDPQ